MSPGPSLLQSRTHVAREGFGKPVRRVEDKRLVTGQGRYDDDFNLPGQAYACFVRSPHAHARIRHIDNGAALKVPGVIAVLTGADAAADGLKPIPHRPVPANPHEPQLRNRDGSAHFIAPHPPLPADRVRLVGEAVAMVIAESAAAARDGAETVSVDYEPLPVVITAADAATAGAPLVWDEAGSNVCVDSDCGDAAAADAAFGRAAHVVRLETIVNRVTGVPMEPRAALAVYDAERDHYTLYAGSGGSQRIRNDLKETLGIPSSAVRVVARDVGGNYGTRNAFYPEFALAPWAARRVGRPVKWTCERRETLLTDFHARDLVSHLELALDREGSFLALRGVHTSNVGAHAVSFIPLGKGLGVLPSLYHFPAAYVRALAVLSHTSPTYPYRSAGRPEAIYVVERLIDIAARRHGFDRVALRRRNLVPTSAMPYRNAMGLTYDSGDYVAALDRVVALADWKGFEARRAEARRRGRYRGIGLSTYLELNTGAPRERAEITVRADGRIDVVIGTLSSGQGHETSFAQLLVEWFGVELSQVRLITGDTDVAPVGGGSTPGAPCARRAW
jgi:aerobic carbon-monoxide dehydrogenase large subunit